MWMRFFSFMRKSSKAAEIRIDEKRKKTRLEKEREL